MISGSFTITAWAMVMLLVLIRFGGHKAAAANRRYVAVVVAVLAVAAILQILRPNAQCVRLNETRLASLR